MRTVTFSDQNVIRDIQEDFIATWFNQAKDLFPGEAAPGSQQPELPEDYLRNFPDGAGGPNVKIFFCDAQSRILHFVQGHYRAEALREEIKFARELHARVEGAGSAKAAATEIRALHERRSATLTEELRAGAQSGATAQESALRRVRIENHRVALERLLLDPRPFMVNEARGIA